MSLAIQTKIQPLTLHAHVSGPNPHKVAIVLEILKLPYDVKLWEFGDDFYKGVKGDTFTRINENGRVPALEDPNTGVVAWESGAVINYLRREYDPANILGPRGINKQDQIDLEKWEYFLLTTLGPMTGQVVWFRYVVASTVVIGSSKRAIIRYYNANKNKDGCRQVCQAGPSGLCYS